MIKKATYHLALLTAILFLYACSSADRSESEMKAEEAYDDVNELHLDAVSPTANQEIFRKLARQNIRDLEDYLRLLADPQLDKGFKGQVQEQLNKLFVRTSLNQDTIMTDTAIGNEIGFLREGSEFTRLKNFTDVSFQDSNGTFMASSSITLPDGSHEQVVITFVIHELDKQFGDEKVKVKELKIEDIRAKPL